MTQTSTTSPFSPIRTEAEAYSALKANIVSPGSRTYASRAAEALAFIEETGARRTRILGLVQEALSQLRLDMKYLIFDLEATRRERDSYKEQLDGK